MQQEKSPEDEAFDAITQSQMKKATGDETIRYRDAFPKEYTIHDIMPVSRNETLEEVAKEFDNMKVLGDTAASFAAFVRAMKR